MTNFTSEQLQSLMTAAKELKGQQPKDISTNDYLQLVLMDKIDTLSQTEAAEIIDKMETAISEYNNSYNRGIELGAVPAEDMLKNAIANNNLTEEQAVNFLVATIVLVKNYGKDAQKLTDDELKAQIEAVINGREVNDSTIEELIQEAAATINAANVMAIDEKTAATVAANPLDASTIETIREQAASPLYIAVAAYIANAKGELQLAENENTPEAIAAGVAAGIKVLELNADLSEGKIDLPSWIKYMKVAVGVVLGLAVVALVLPLIAAFAINALLGGLLVFGSVTAAVWVASLLTIGVIAVGSSMAYDKREQLIDTYTAIFDTAIAWITGLKIKEFVKKCYNTAAAKIKEYIQKIKKLTKQTAEPTTELQPAPNIIDVQVAETNNKDRKSVV